MIDVSGLTEISLGEVASLPAESIVAVEHTGAWSVIVKREFSRGLTGWSFPETIDQVGVLMSAEPDGAVLSVYDPKLDEFEYENWDDIGRVFAVGNEPTAVGRIIAWTDDDTGRSAAILVSVRPRRWQGSGCSFTSEDSQEAFLEVLQLQKSPSNFIDLKIYLVPLGWG